MAQDMQVGQVDLEDGTYQVILRRVVAAPAQVAPPAQVGPQQAPVGGAKKSKKAKGTRKLSGYMKFAQEIRPQLLKEDPSLRSDIPSIGRKIGEKWRALTAEEKARY